MTTNLDRTISNTEDAQAFLQDLMNNGEIWHPDDNAHDVIWMIKEPPTHTEMDKLNELMHDVHKYINDPPQYVIDYYYKIEHNENKDDH